MTRVLVEAGLVVAALVVGYVVGKRRADGAMRMPFVQGPREGGGRKTIAR